MSTASGKMMLVNWEIKKKNCFLGEAEYFLGIQVDSSIIAVSL